MAIRYVDIEDDKKPATTKRDPEKTASFRDALPPKGASRPVGGGKASDDAKAGRARKGAGK